MAQPRLQLHKGKLQLVLDLDVGTRLESRLSERLRGLLRKVATAQASE